MSVNFEAAPDRRILRLRSVMERTGMGRSWIYREVAAGRFPVPIKIGRASGWDARAIDSWLDELLLQTASSPSEREA